MIEHPSTHAASDSISGRQSISESYRLRTEHWLWASRWIGAALVGGFVFLMFNPLRGGESAHAISDDIVISLDGSQRSYGAETVFGFAGQTLNVHCNAQIRTGYLDVYIWRRPTVPLSGAEPPLHKFSVRANEPNSQQQIEIDRTGFYRIEIAPRRIQNRFDISYDVSWFVK